MSAEVENGAEGFQADGHESASARSERKPPVRQPLGHSGVLLMMLVLTGCAFLAITAVTEIAGRVSTSGFASEKINTINADISTRLEAVSRLSDTAGTGLSFPEFLALSMLQIQSQRGLLGCYSEYQERVASLERTGGEFGLSVIEASLLGCIEYVNSEGPRSSTVVGIPDVQLNLEQSLYPHTLNRELDWSSRAIVLLEFFLSFDWISFNWLATLSNDILSAIAVVSCGVVGAAVSTLRDRGGLWIRSIGLGFAAGFIVFLLLKGGRFLLFFQSPIVDVPVNPYAGAFAGVLAGLFTERAYTALSKILDRALTGNRDHRAAG